MKPYKIAIIVAVTLTAFGGSIGLFGFKLTAGIADAGTGFMQRLAADGPDAAYASASTAFQVQTSRSALASLSLRMHLTDLAQIGWSSRSVTGSTGTLSGSATLKSGTTLPIEMTLVKEGDVWKVTGLTIPGGLNAPAEAPTGGYDDALAALEAKDYARALTLLRPLAEQGMARAQSNLGVLYWQGLGTPADPIEAARWLEKAAAQGNANAEYGMGLLLREGRGVPKDALRAAGYFNLASAQDHPDARFNLATMYENGEGVPMDKKAAIGLYQLAADQGQTDAQNNLGILYATGNGVPTDPVQAYEWFSLAARQHQEHAQANLERVSKTMNAEQRAAAEKLVAAWRAK